MKFWNIKSPPKQTRSSQTPKVADITGPTRVSEGMLEDSSLFDIEQIASVASFVSEACRLEHFLAPRYRYWCDRLKENGPRLHRKQWEWVYICAALHERDMLRSGLRALGFGVGTEPLADLFASYGIQVTATDQATEQAERGGWNRGQQHSQQLEDLHIKKISPVEIFYKNVSFRVADMNNIAADLTNYDFCWSACAYEHLGSIDHGVNFIKNTLKTLRKGGISIHTTELNLTSDDATLESEHLSLFRKQDFKRMASELRSEGHEVAPLCFYPGAHQLDQHIDLPPYCNDPHIRRDIEGYAVTSMGIIVTKGA